MLFFSTVCVIVGVVQLEKITCKDIGCLEPWLITALLREQSIPRIVNNKHNKNEADNYNRDRIGNFFQDVQIKKSDPAATGLQAADSYSGAPMPTFSWRIPNQALTSAAINQDLKIHFDKSEATHSNVHYVHIHHHYINLNTNKNKNTLITQYMQSGDDTNTSSMPATDIQALPATQRKQHTNSLQEDNVITKKSENTTPPMQRATDIVSSTESSSNAEYSAYNVPLN